MNKYDYNKLTPFKWFILENFPLIDEDFDALTNWQLFCKLGKEINKIINSQNNVGQQMENVTNAFIVLQNYVENYFNNLDVQDEINNKLDSLVEDGTLTELIGNYVDPKLLQFQSNVDSQITTQNANIQQIEVTTQSAINLQNTAISNMENRINTIASGSPAGVYDTVSELETADPDHTKIYLVTATGNWYYYDTSSTDWVSGGTYQSTGVSDVQPWQTVFYSDNNLLPKDNYIQGKVLNASNGSVVDWVTGSYNAEYIEVDYTKLYLVINNSDLTYSVPTFYTYDTNKDFLGYVRPSVDTRTYSVTFESDVKYVRVAFWNINSKTLATNEIFIKLEDALKLPSYNANYSIKNNYFNAIQTDNITISNDYGFRLVPYQVVAAGNSYTTLYYPTIYEMKSTNVATAGANFIGVAFDYDTSKLRAGDKIYVDASGSSTFTSISLFATASSSSNTLALSNLGNGLYCATLTSEILTAMNNAKGVNNYYPRLMTIRPSATSGETLTTNMRCWINEDFTDLTSFLDNVVDELNEAKSKETLSALVLGDSITALTGDRSWLTYFNLIQPINVIQNVAVSGAWLMDKENTIYDGNPVFNGPDDNENNVLGNQVQKIINNDYDAPDIILIAIGTNAGINCTKEDIYDSYYDSNGNLIPLENVDRKTSAGAFRYCNTVLRDKYPNATIFWCSPIQATYTLKKPDIVIEWGENLKNLTEFASVQFIDTQDCGITAYTETSGTNGLYLIDGLHPNSNGAKYMGFYNATKVKEYTEACKLFNQ